MNQLKEKLKRTIALLIQKSEQYTKTDTQSLAKNGFWLTLGQGIGTVSGLAVTVVLANLLTPEALGSYKYILSIYGLVTVFSLSGMATALTRATAQGKEGTLQYTTLLSLRWGLVMSALAILAGGYYLYRGNLVLGWSLTLIALFAPLFQSLGLYAAFVNGKKDYRTYSLFSISYNTIPPLILIATAFVTQEVLPLVAAFLAGGTLIQGIHYYLTIRKYKPNNSIDKATVGYGKHLSLMNIIGGISFQLDKILIWSFLGAAPLAMYTIATAPPQQLRYLNKILGTIALPKFSNRNIKELQATMKHKATILLTASILIVITYWFAAPYLYQFLFPKYLDAIFYSQVFSLIILFFPAVLFQEALNAHMRKKELYVIQTAIPILKIASLFILLPPFGIWGVFASMFIAETTRMILVTKFFYSIKTS